MEPFGAATVESLGTATVESLATDSMESLGAATVESLGAATVEVSWHDCFIEEALDGDSNVDCLDADFTVDCLDEACFGSWVSSSDSPTSLSSATTSVGIDLGTGQS